ncbi:MAG: hypothetical protein LBK46_00980, partial [Oscillospiraceae bacterium]|nr:hypothetical protein [Oscillospiraceae bacterium]
GELSIREDDAPKLLVRAGSALAESNQSSVQSADEAQTQSYRLHLRLSDDAQMRSILTILDSHPGGMPVCFHLAHSRKVISNRARCDGSDLLFRDLKTCIGEENIKLKEDAVKQS